MANSTRSRDVNLIAENQMNDLQTKTSQILAPLMNGKSSVCQGGENLDKDVDVKIIKDHWECVVQMSRCNFFYYLYDKPSALFYHLNPVLERIIAQKEAEDFLYPVDAVALGVPDYYDVIKNPMDLSTIKMKLQTGQYSVGMKFVEDYWLMSHNAWTYNKKSTRVYRNCRKLAAVFKSLIDRPMKQLGYCCGQYYTIEAKNLLCISKQNCVIPKLAPYWSCKDRYFLCGKCYEGIREDTVTFQNSCENIIFDKKEFVLKYNDEIKKELFIKCGNCGIEWHKVCSLYLDEIWKDGFLCEHCLRLKGQHRAPHKYTSENLQPTKIGSHIEERVSNFLKNKGCNSKVVIRLVCNAKKSLVVKNDIKSRFVESGVWPEQFPYSAKTLLAFQRIDGSDVCFFAMFLQEYGANCLQPNTRCVYLSYLDSVHFFSPKELRTSVYHEILLGYFDYVKKQGFLKIHLWACPPKEGADYVFFCHPKEQKTPKMVNLLEWYKTLLNKAIAEKIVKDYKDMYTQAIEDNLKDVSQLPYFEGDFLQGTLEREIPRLQGIEETKVDEPRKKTVHRKLKRNKKNYKKNSEAGNNCQVHSVGDPLTDKILLFLHSHKEEFLVIHLSQDFKKPKLQFAVDADPAIQSELICLRETFLEFCRVHDYEFSSLRHAKYSSLVLLYELHKENVDVFSCNLCKKTLETGHHCTLCKDFDLCNYCFYKGGHHHEMEELRIEPETKVGYLDRNDARSVVFSHISICMDGECRFPKCKDLKEDVWHLRKCEENRITCQKCLSVFPYLARHAIICKMNECLVQFCRLTKYFSNLRTTNAKQCVMRAGNEIFFNNYTLCKSTSKNALHLNFKNSIRMDHSSKTGVSVDLHKAIKSESNLEKTISAYSESQASQTMSNMSQFLKDYYLSEYNYRGNDLEVSESKVTVSSADQSQNLLKIEYDGTDIKSEYSSNAKTVSYRSDKSQNISSASHWNSDLSSQNVQASQQSVHSQVGLDETRSSQNEKNSKCISVAPLKMNLSKDILEQDYPLSKSAFCPEKPLSNREDVDCNSEPNIVFVSQVPEQPKNETSARDPALVKFPNVQIRLKEYSDAFPNVRLINSKLQKLNCKPLSMKKISLNGNNSFQKLKGLRVVKPGNYNGKGHSPGNTQDSKEKIALALYPKMKQVVLDESTKSLPLNSYKIVKDLNLCSAIVGNTEAATKNKENPATSSITEQKKGSNGANTQYVIIACSSSNKCYRLPLREPVNFKNRKLNINKSNATSVMSNSTSESGNPNSAYSSVPETSRYESCNNSKINLGTNTEETVSRQFCADSTKKSSSGSNQTSNSGKEFPVTQQVLVSVGNSRTASCSENKPGPIPANAPLAFSKRFRYKKAFVLKSQSNFNEKEPFIATGSNYRNLETNFADHSGTSFVPFSEDKSAYKSKDNYPVHQPLKYRIANGRYPELSVSEQHYASNNNESLPQFQTLQGRSNFDTPRNKNVSLSRNNFPQIWYKPVPSVFHNNTDALQNHPNSALRISNARNNTPAVMGNPTHFVHPVYFHNGRGAFEKTSNLNSIVSVNKNSDLPDFRNPVTSYATQGNVSSLQAFPHVASYYYPATDEKRENLTQSFTTVQNQPTLTNLRTQNAPHGFPDQQNVHNSTRYAYVVNHNTRALVPVSSKESDQNVINDNQKTYTCLNNDQNNVSYLTSNIPNKVLSVPQECVTVMPNILPSQPQKYVTVKQDLSVTPYIAQSDTLRNAGKLPSLDTFQTSVNNSQNSYVTYSYIPANSLYCDSNGYVANNSSQNVPSNTVFYTKENKYGDSQYIFPFEKHPQNIEVAASPTQLQPYSYRTTKNIQYEPRPPSTRGVSKRKQFYKNVSSRKRGRGLGRR